MLPIRTILHANDFSKHSDSALQLAAAIALGHDARLIVLHILQAAEPPVWLYDRMAGTFPWTVDSHEALEQRIRTVKKSHPGLRAEFRVTEGIPAEEILRAAKEDACDLIVMGTQGQTGLDRVLAGSVAAEVMSKAACPVVTVKDSRPLPTQQSEARLRVEATAACVSGQHDEFGDDLWSCGRS